MYRKFGEVWTGRLWKRTDRQTNRQVGYTDRDTDTLIAILCTSSGQSKNTFQALRILFACAFEWVYI